MKRRFICLANSKKYTQRCIAGIELVKSQRRGFRYDVVKKDNQPLWLRPVSGSEHGEVEASFVDHINLLDVVEVNVTNTHFEKSRYQSENVLFEPQILPVIERIEGKVDLLDKLVWVAEIPLFGSRGRTVSINDIETLDYSLLLIKPTAWRVYTKRQASGLSPAQAQTRASFLYNRVSYDLPITDVDFIAVFRYNPYILQNYKHVYLTISLGLPFEGRYYKLVAGITYF